MICKLFIQFTIEDGRDDLNKKKMHAVGLELVNHVYSDTSDPSAALPTAPGCNLVVQMTKLIYVNFKSILFNGKMSLYPNLPLEME